jgi:hypothetical protein
MEQRKKRISLVVLVGTLLLVAVLASLASSTWATPEQIVRANGQTIPQKYCDDDMVAPGQSTEMRILLTNPSSASDTWTSTVVTDTVDENLQITGLHTTQGSASWTGREVTFTIGTMAPGTSVTLRIYVDVKDDARQGYDVNNTAWMSHTGWGPVSSVSTPMFRVAYLQYLPLTMKRFP